MRSPRRSRAKRMLSAHRFHAFAKPFTRKAHRFRHIASMRPPRRSRAKRTLPAHRFHALAAPFTRKAHAFGISLPRARRAIHAQSARFRRIASMRHAAPFTRKTDASDISLPRARRAIHAQNHRPMRAALLTAPRSPVRAPARARPASRRGVLSDRAACRERDRNNRAFRANTPPAARPRRSARRRSAARP